MADYPAVTILISDDVKTVEAATQEGVWCTSLYKYLTSVKDKTLLDSVRHATIDAEGENIYEEYLPLEQLNEGIKKGIYYTGPLRTNRYNWLEANVPADNLEEDILVKGYVNMNRSIDGDIVVVELFDEDKWESPSMYFIDSDAPYAEEISDVDTKFLKSHPDAKKRPTGKVIGKLRSSFRPYVGVIDFQHKETDYAIFQPLNKRSPKIKLKLSEPKKYTGKRIVCTIDGWDRNSLLPHGHYVRTIGNVGEKATEEESILLQNDIVLKEWEPEIIRELPSDDDPIIVTEDRKDLRHLSVVSIDPPGCTDIDDALHVVKLENGNYQLGVHIADVTHYVKEGSHLDERARKTGNSVYLVDRRIDMIPRVLSENLCSLNSNVDRYAFSVIWEVTDDMEVKNIDFHKSVIRSRAAFSYTQAQQRINDLSMDDEISWGIRKLHHFSQILKQRRLEKGSLTLASTDVNFIRDEETQDPIDIELYESKDTNSLVEEFMLLANIAVAEKIIKHFPTFSLLRRHPPPRKERLEQMARSLLKIVHGDINFDTSTSKTLSESLEAIKKNLKSQSFDKVLRVMVTRCMDQARYFSSGTLTPDMFPHYGLAIPLYTHFTSPIRRYSDVVVHRLLGASLGIYPLTPQLTQMNVKRTCDIINRRHRMAELASRDSVRFKTIDFFKGKTTEEKGYVTNIAPNAVTVLVLKYGIEGTLYLSDDPSKEWNLDLLKNEITSPCKRFTIGMFETIDVRFHVDESNPLFSKIVFKCIRPNIEECEGSSVNDGKSRSCKRKIGTNTNKVNKKKKVT